VAVSRRETKTVYWYQRQDDATWVRRMMGTALQLSYALGVAVLDINHNGLLDIFGGEQEDPDTYMEADGLLAMKPRGLRERGVIWCNTGDSLPTFEPVVIHSGRPSWYDVALGDIDRDGDADLVSKVWNADGPNYHVDYWRNDISS